MLFRSIKEMPEMQIASVLSIGVQNIGNAYNTLISWAISKNIFPKENVKMITVYHDSFKVTAPNKVRIHAGMLLEEAIKNEGEVFLEILPKEKYRFSTRNYASRIRNCLERTFPLDERKRTSVQKRMSL